MLFNYIKTIYSQVFNKDMNSLDWFIEQATVIPKNKIFKDLYLIFLITMKMASKIKCCCSTWLIKNRLINVINWSN